MCVGLIDTSHCLDGVYHTFFTYSALIPPRAAPDVVWMYPCHRTAVPEKCFTRLLFSSIAYYRWLKLRPSPPLPVSASPATPETTYERLDLVGPLLSKMLPDFEHGCTSLQDSKYKLACVRAYTLFFFPKFYDTLVGGTRLSRHVYSYVGPSEHLIRYSNSSDVLASWCGRFDQAGQRGATFATCMRTATGHLSGKKPRRALAKYSHFVLPSDSDA